MILGIFGPGEPVGVLAAFEELDFLHSMAAFLARPSEVADLDGYLVREGSLAIVLGRGTPSGASS